MLNSDDKPDVAAATVIILAGGGSARMGDRPKWRLPWAGVTLLEHIAAQARAAAAETLVVGGKELDVPAGATQVADVFAGCGPLGGLHAGLSAARFERCLAVACDMPFVRPQVMGALLALGADHDAAVPLAADGVHPLLAAYSRRCLPAIERRLRDGDRRMVSFFERVRVRWVTELELRRFDPDLLALFNINTWREYERARELAAVEVAP
jgi:molybdopterin-guanine dinucleotide biosynthesis protein A